MRLFYKHDRAYAAADGGGFAVDGHLRGADEHFNIVLSWLYRWLLAFYAGIFCEGFIYLAAGILEIGA